MDKALRNSSHPATREQPVSPQVEHGAGLFGFLILVLMTTALIGVAQEIPDPLRWFAVGGGMLILCGCGLKLLAHYLAQIKLQKQE